MIRVKTSSVARGGRGGLEPPHWLVKYAKSHVFCAFEADFLWEMENSPPSIVWTCEIGRKIALSFGEDLFFFFWDHLILGGKNVWILDFGRKITLKFGEDLFFWRSSDFGRKKRLNFGFRPKNHSEVWRRPFFFWRSSDFGRKKRLNFRDISSKISDKPSETDSTSMKIRVKVVCTLLTVSK